MSREKRKTTPAILASSEKEGSVACVSRGIVTATIPLLAASAVISHYRLSLELVYP
jgi:hypothetical protein